MEFWQVQVKVGRDVLGYHMRKGPEIEKPGLVCSLRSLGGAARRCG